VLRLDDDVAITEVVDGDVVLRHYAFGDRWFKINVTTDLLGRLVETGPPHTRFAFNCDIATPMERDGSSTYGVDLFVDVLVRSDLRSFHVGDEDEFEQALADGLISPNEAKHSRHAVTQLLELVESDRLLPWLHEVFPFGPSAPPDAAPMHREPVPKRLLPRHRRTW
jgi:predicted RNA-binding protein associated with RNAse of E/G family